MKASNRLRARARTAFERWCRDIDTDERSRVRGLFDPRRERVDWQADTSDGPVAWRALPIVLRGREMDEDAEAENRMWTRDLTEYVNGHEEVGFYLREQRFHICRAHPAARQVIATGIVAARFSCPLQQRSCPFAAASASATGAPIHLVPVDRGRDGDPG